MTYEEMTISQLEAEINRRNETIAQIRSEMPAIREVIDRKTDYWMTIGRFEGWTEEEKADFAKLAQGIGA